MKTTFLKSILIFAILCTTSHFASAEIFFNHLVCDPISYTDRAENEEMSVAINLYSSMKQPDVCMGIVTWNYPQSSIGSDQLLANFSSATKDQIETLTTENEYIKIALAVDYRNTIPGQGLKFAANLLISEFNYQTKQWETTLNGQTKCSPQQGDSVGGHNRPNHP